MSSNVKAISRQQSTSFNRDQIEAANRLFEKLDMHPELRQLAANVDFCGVRRKFLAMGEKQKLAIVKEQAAG